MTNLIRDVEIALHGGPQVPARFRPGDVGPLDCFPLHTRLSPEAQDKAMNSVPPIAGRKLIGATHEAGTSLTLTGITHVIDSMRIKIKCWNPRDESWRFVELPISKATAAQRSGRCGREKDGNAIRMCTQRGYMQGLQDHETSGVSVSDMLSECLTIMVAGHSPVTFEWLDVSPDVLTAFCGTKGLRRVC